MFRVFAPLALALVALPLAGCGRSEEARDAALAGGYGVRGAVLKMNANPDAPSAAYFTFAAGPSPRVIVRATSEDFDRVEMHESRMTNGVMEMAPLARVAVPADGEVVFRQGGKHLMLYGMSEAARTHHRATIVLHFEDGGNLPVVFSFSEPTAAATPSAASSGGAGTHSGH